MVRPGALAGELHVDNRLAAALHAKGRGGLRYRREVFRALPALARDLETRPEYRAIEMIGGSSLFWQEATAADSNTVACRRSPNGGWCGGNVSCWRDIIPRAGGVSRRDVAPRSGRSG